jgi:hypothetical protein
MHILNSEVTKESKNPVLVRANKVGEVVIGWNPKTAANWRSKKIGPPYYQDDSGSVFYRVDEVIDFFTRYQVQTKGCSMPASELEK